MGYVRSRLHPVTRTPDFILRDHHILISLDGFDTLATADGRDLVAACNRLHARYSKAHYYSVRWENYTQIVTSRCYITIDRSISGEYYIYTVHSEVEHPCIHSSLQLCLLSPVFALDCRLGLSNILVAIGLHYSLDIGAMRMVGCRQRAMDTMSSRQSEFSQAILAPNLVSESILYLRSLTGTI
jgi:hypothetical protein